MSFDITTRPKNVTIAVIIVAANFLVSIAMLIPNITSDVIITDVITGLLLYFVYMGRNWARIIFIFAYVVGLAFIVYNLVTTITPLGVLLHILLVCVIEGVAVFLLLRPDSSLWFRAKQA